MLPKTHLILSLIPFILLFPAYKYLTFAFFIGSFLIDFDHYLWYIIRFKKFNLEKAYQYYLPENRKYREKDLLHIFHVWEFWLLMLILSFAHMFFLIIFFGIIFHLLLDFIDLYLNKTYGLRAISYFFWLKRHPNLIA